MVNTTTTTATATLINTSELLKGVETVIYYENSQLKRIDSISSDNTLKLINFSSCNKVSQIFSVGDGKGRKYAENYLDCLFNHIEYKSQPTYIKLGNRLTIQLER